MMRLRSVARWQRCACRPCRLHPYGDRIFLNYRGVDSAGWTTALREKLVPHFGKQRVFMDVRILPGEDYRTAIRRELSSCSVVLVVIGTKWLTVTDKNGQRRIDYPNDMLRQELELANELQAGVRCIPVLVDGAYLPTSRELPDSLAFLAYKNPQHLTPPNFDANVDALIAHLDKPRPNRFARWKEIRGVAPVWALIANAMWRPLWTNTLVPIALLATGLITGAPWLVPVGLVLYVGFAALTLFDLQQARCVRQCLQEAREAAQP